MKTAIPLSKGCSSSSRLRSNPSSSEATALLLAPASGIKGRVTRARLFEAGTSDSTLVRKLAAVSIEAKEEHLRNTSVHRIKEEYIRQASEEIEGRVIKKLSQEISRTESRIPGALSKLDKFS